MRRVTLHLAGKETSGVFFMFVQRVAENILLRVPIKKLETTRKYQDRKMTGWSNRATDSESLREKAP